MKKIGMILIGVLICFGTYAQEPLSLQMAIQLALDNNFNIQLIEKDLEVAENNTYLGNTGMLPSISADLSKNASIQNSTQTLLSGDTRSVDNGKSRSSGYGATLDWTIFDGFRMFTRYDQLKTIQELEKANVKQEILTTINEVVSTYYGLVNLEQQMDAFTTAIELSKYRYEVADNRYLIGRASKLEVLAAKVDLNTDTTKLLHQENLIQTYKTRMNELLARDLQMNFSITDSILINPSLQRDELMKLAEGNNPDIKLAFLNTQMAFLRLKEIKGARYPVLNARTSYTISNSSAELGFATKSEGKGFNYGITASMNVFNGSRQRRNERESKILIEKSELNLANVSQAIQAQLNIAYDTYLTHLKLASLEEKNAGIAKQNLDITLEKFNIGSIAPLEYREAQRNYIDAVVRFNDARYQAKLAEVVLRQISGTLDL